MPDRRLYFISDLHLGDGTRADRFLHPEALLKLLDRVGDEPGAELVLVGDLLELWACNLGAVMSRHAVLLRRLSEVAAARPVTYVVGNHDSAPFYLYLGAQLGPVRLVERYVTRLGGDTLMAVHGHQYDPFNRVAVTGGEIQAPWTQKLVQILGALERAGLGGLVNTGSDTADALLVRAQQAEAGAAGADGPGGEFRRRLLQVVKDVILREPPGQRDYPLGESRYREAALDLMRQGARWVVMGHTHHPDRVAAGRKLYLNTGCWCWDRYPPTYARWDGGDLRLYDADSGAVFTSFQGL